MIHFFFRKSKKNLINKEYREYVDEGNKKINEAIDMKNEN